MAKSKQYDPITIIHDTRKFGWSQSELYKFQELWTRTQGMNTFKRIDYIADHMKEDATDIVFLMIDRLDRGIISFEKERK